MHFIIDDLVRLAKRDNNTKRPYLYVNPLQGKHIPANPQKTMDMCKELAEKVNNKYSEEKLYVIGFAETATGIASGVCNYLENVLYFQNTTRETSGCEEYIFFTESHSHATDQMLKSANLEEAIDQVDRILFIDDEVTTGNTICKLIDGIKNNYNVRNTRFSIVSVLNSMPSERLAQLNQMGIDCLFLSELLFEYKKDSIMDIAYDKNSNTIMYSEEHIPLDIMIFNTRIDVRNANKFSDYISEIKRFTNMVMEKYTGFENKKVLVLGTEECMFPAIYLGYIINERKNACDVKVHATTRSPILASDVSGYPLFHRYQIRSLYNEERTTYIYNLGRYDKVIIITDAEKIGCGVYDLMAALRSLGNNDVVLYQWKYD